MGAVFCKNGERIKIMRKFLPTFLLGVIFVSGANANSLEFDSSDPLYMPHAEEVLSESTVSLGHDILRFGEKLSYGLNNRLTVSASVHYQNEFGGDNDGRKIAEKEKYSIKRI